MKVWVYQPRNEDVRVFAEDQFATARFEQDLDNGCTPLEAQENGLEVGGSEEEGYFYIDDGGSIRLVEVE